MATLVLAPALAACLRGPSFAVPVTSSIARLSLELFRIIAVSLSAWAASFFRAEHAGAPDGGDLTIKEIPLRRTVSKIECSEGRAEPHGAPATGLG